MTAKAFKALILLPALFASEACNTRLQTTGLPPAVSHSRYTIQSGMAVDSAAERYIRPYRDSVAQQMNRVIGTNAQNLTAYAPESPLSNFVADLMLESSVQIAREKNLQTPHMALVNIRGLRGMLPAGKITVGVIFQLMPFENQMVLVRLSGSQLIDLFRHMATFNGDGISGASFAIQANQTVSRPLVAEHNIDPHKEYWIATSDYLANGGDYYTLLTQSPQIPLNITIREMIIRHIEHLTASGKTIESTTDQRIVYEN